MNHIIDMLKDNKVGIIPTETVLGLVTSFDNSRGIKYIYKIKNRDSEKKLSIIFENFDQITNNFDIIIDKKFKALSTFFWPGPLTIVKKDVNNVSYGFRKPDNDVINYILSNLEKPLVATSVNLSGQRPAKKVAQIDANIISKVDFVLNQDALGKAPSTVYDIDNDKILREGPISLDQIHKVFDEWV